MSRRAAKPKKISVLDAAGVIGSVRDLVTAGRLNPQVPAVAQIGAIAANILAQWEASPVVLRLDPDFAGALLDSDTDAELVADWLDRLPFDAFAVSFAEPISLHDGEVLCHYTGFVVCGISSRRTGRREGNFDRIWTTYGPFSEHNGVRLLWTYTQDDSPLPRGQSVTFMLRGELGRPADGVRTIGEEIAGQLALNEQEGRGYGQEYSTLYPLSLLTLLYLSAHEPDVDWLPAESISRPQQLAAARVGNVGWRVGSALREYRRQAGESTRRDVQGPRRLPPHIRKAHFHRFRMATRDAAGNIIGNRLGEHGADWFYDLRWVAPTPVGVEDGAMAPAVRPVPAQPAGSADTPVA